MRPGGASYHVIGGGIQVVQAGGGAVSPLYASLVAFWKLDEVSGSRADSVGANTLTDNNTVTSNTGLVYPLAAEFTAANSEHLSIADNAALSTGDIDFWLAAWMYRTTGGSGDRVVFTKPSELGEYYLAVRSENSMFTPNVSTAISGFINTWRLVWFTYDSATNKDGIAIDNGSLVIAGSARTPPADSTGAFSIGAQADTLRRFNGRIGPVMMGKNYLPTAADRTALYNGGAGLTLAQMAAL